MSFQEKGIWVSLISTLLLFGYYFSKAIGIYNNPEVDDYSLIALFIGIVTLIVVIQIVLQSVIAIVNRREAEKGKDERDKLIELKVTKISYYVLVFGVWITLFSMMFNSSLIMMANVIMFFFVLSQIIGFSLQLFYYRRGF